MGFYLPPWAERMCRGPAGGLVLTPGAKTEETQALPSFLLRAERKGQGGTLLPCLLGGGWVGVAMESQLQASCAAVMTRPGREAK